VLELEGRATCAVPANFAALGSLTQLDSLQLRAVDWDTRNEHLCAALSPLTRLTRLDLYYTTAHLQSAVEHDDDEYQYSQDSGDLEAFPWETAVCGLTNLQELHVSSDRKSHGSITGMVFGALPAALSQLTALRRLAVLGMSEWEVRDYPAHQQLQLAALPALETAALRLHTSTGEYPGLGLHRQVALSRLVSLSLALRNDATIHDQYEATHLPAIIAPALTELILDDILLAPDSEQLDWLPGLPKLRRLVLEDLKTAAIELPNGIAACSGLTELVLKRVLVRFDNEPRGCLSKPECRLRSMPADGPYLSQLVRLSLCKNAFSAVPSCLAAATALELLDLAKQKLRDSYYEAHGAPVRDLHVLDGLARLRCVNLEGFRNNGAGLRRFRKAHLNVRVVL